MNNKRLRESYFFSAIFPYQEKIDPFRSTNAIFPYQEKIEMFFYPHP
jgi:hypothetical protein